MILSEYSPYQFVDLFTSFGEVLEKAWTKQREKAFDSVKVGGIVEFGNYLTDIKDIVRPNN